MQEQLVGVLLAGGASRRFGSPKAFATMRGKPLYEFSLEALGAIAESVLIVTNDQLEDKFKTNFKIKLIKDIEPYKGKGPLAGIYSAMQARKADWYAFAPVDVPFILPEVFQILLEQREQGGQAVIPFSNGRIQPLIALYHHSLAARIKELLDTDQLAMRALIDIAKVKYVPFTEDASFININRQDDYKRHNTNRG